MGQLKSSPFNQVRSKDRIKKLIDHVDKLIKSNQILNQINQGFSNIIVVDGQVHVFDQTKWILIVTQWLNPNHRAGKIETN